MRTRRARLWRALGWGPLLLLLLLLLPWTFSGSSMAPTSMPPESPAEPPGAAAVSPAPTPTSGLGTMVSTVEAQVSALRELAPLGDVPTEIVAPASFRAASLQIATGAQ